MNSAYRAEGVVGGKGGFFLYIQYEHGPSYDTTESWDGAFTDTGWSGKRIVHLTSHGGTGCYSSRNFTGER